MLLGVVTIGVNSGVKVSCESDGMGLSGGTDVSRRFRAAEKKDLEEKEFTSSQSSVTVFPVWELEFDRGRDNDEG
jgi:hypothetical protein